MSKSRQGGVLSGMIFDITGALSRPRKEVEDLIKDAGGRVGSDNECSCDKRDGFRVKQDDQSKVVGC